MYLTALEKSIIAFARNEVEQLLIGDDIYLIPYDRFAPIPRGIEHNDICLVSWGLVPFQGLNIHDELGNKVQEAFTNICKTNKGLRIVAGFIMLQSSDIKNNAPRLKLDHIKLAEIVRQQIVLRKDELRNEKLYGGANYENGLLGELKRLSTISAEYNDPTFV